MSSLQMNLNVGKLNSSDNTLKLFPLKRYQFPIFALSVPMIYIFNGAVYFIRLARKFYSYFSEWIIIFIFCYLPGFTLKEVKILSNLCQITRGLPSKNEHHLKGVRHHQINKPNLLTSQYRIIFQQKFNFHIFYQ